ncbi:type 1 fimbrial protein [Enterobacter asburiae]|uniref:fimbrial protein n=1 Tax=Enterobacter asburiae TaxID=61645 RepID=UPI00192B2EEA|nr:fimbrial protein [Enterobacter asburiae]MBL5841184.1 type 1 fimbrial protein [Enterobacter asburiae]MBL5912402.1 type 1 fimbrial protein [Enterobacter asburiae]MBL5916911.1 type 1 fimbrial protein [Enterobacter asburiae]MBL5941552.1 type 1 fimbrial protein [Enterobacter asburiae]MBL5972020.1 type 1 fimbrial protein [Enterobacter asburiae]
MGKTGNARNSGANFHRVTGVISLAAAALSLALTTFSAAALDNNVQISGRLVNEPCTLDPSTSDITLVFGNLVAKYFYTTNRTPGEPFTIRLLECDTSVAKTATVTFTGAESGGLPGLLAPDAGDTQGIAFGIETDDASAQPVPLNKPSPVFDLGNGTTELHLRGYVQGEPDAIENNSILTGPFTGTATFELAYP